MAFAQGRAQALAGLQDVPPSVVLRLLKQAVRIKGALGPLTQRTWGEAAQEAGRLAGALRRERHCTAGAAWGTESSQLMARLAVLACRTASQHARALVKTARIACAATRTAAGPADACR